MPFPLGWLPSLLASPPAAVSCTPWELTHGKCRRDICPAAKEHFDGADDEGGAGCDDWHEVLDAELDREARGED